MSVRCRPSFSCLIARIGGPAIRTPLALSMALLLLLAAATAEAGVVVRIDLSEQRARVVVDGRATYDWAVSTARPGYRTPVGTFHPIRLERTWYSTKYDFAPMPNSIFFLGGYAIHGTTEIASLGRPVSHGCIRLHPDNARILFDLVLQHGRANTLIQIAP